MVNDSLIANTSLDNAQKATDVSCLARIYCIYNAGAGAGCSKPQTIGHIFLYPLYRPVELRYLCGRKVLLQATFFPDT